MTTVSLTEVSLPDGSTVLGVEKKAMLGQGRLKEVTVPGEALIIDDWAFAGCTALEEVSMPRCALGRGVFKDCRALKHIRVEGAGEDVAALLAEAARQDVTYLLDMEKAGTAEWYELWDAWLVRFVNADDSEGYSGQVPCGEEDYGLSDVAAYESGRRREKARRCLLRLMNPEGLDAGTRDICKQYISGHTLGSPKGDEAWQLLLERYGEEEQWYTAFADAGGIDPSNAMMIIDSIPPGLARMKSFFIRRAGLGTADILSGLDL